MIDRYQHKSYKFSRKPFLYPDNQDLIPTFQPIHNHLTINNMVSITISKSEISNKSTLETNNKDILFSPLCSIQSTPPRFLQRNQNKLQNSVTSISLEYSPDSIFSPMKPIERTENSELLINSQQQDKKTNLRYEISTVESQSSEINCNHSISPLCEPFFIYDLSQSIITCIQYRLLTINSYIFKIEYHPKSQNEPNPFNFDKIATRIKKVLQYSPLEIFHFYTETLSNLSQHSLQLFLLSKEIKYNNNQLSQFEAKLNYILETKRPDQVLQQILFKNDTKDTFILNLDHYNHCEKIDLTNPNFWKAFGPFFRSNHYFRNASMQQNKLKSFLSNLL